MRISDWSSDVCSSDLEGTAGGDSRRAGVSLQVVDIEPQAGEVEAAGEAQRQRVAEHLVDSVLSEQARPVEAAVEAERQQGRGAEEIALGGDGASQDDGLGDDVGSGEAHRAQVELRLWPAEGAADGDLRVRALKAVDA